MTEGLSVDLARARSIDEKIAILNTLPIVGEFFKTHPSLHSLPLECEWILKQLIVIGQIGVLCAGVSIEADNIRPLLEKLIPIDHFYRDMGGLVGYQEKILQLLKNRKGAPSLAKYHSPSFIDIGGETEPVKEAIEWGIEALPEMGEIYPLGGAADRLHLVEETTGLELPAAKLPFAGRTLLEHLIRDLQARERLYFQRYGVELITPVAIMTSHEKNNHAHVMEICERLQFFGRPKESFRFFTQPLVPAVDETGNWCVTRPLEPRLLPGGHGAIWKLARDEGVFTWFERQGRTKGLVRQINNPIAGLDYGLLAFIGIGCKKKMIFGFASCPRLLQAAEGVNVLIENGDQIVLTNIEYSDFAKFGIEDLPLEKGEPYSRFSSNTNILFVDLQEIAKAVDRSPFPGLLINVKNGKARLESTMQNIADVFVEKKGTELKTQKTYVTYNRRSKTISTAKKAFIPGSATQETPENCFYDLLAAHRELLRECGFLLPPQRTLAEYLEQGPECVFLYHPMLGPLYSIIREKLRGGNIALGAELLIEMAHFSAKNLSVQGSLQVINEPAFEGRCILENVQIENQGVDWTRSSPFWKMDLRRRESVKIILKGNSTFTARNLHLRGSHTFTVEHGAVMNLVG